MHGGPGADLRSGGEVQLGQDLLDVFEHQQQLADEIQIAVAPEERRLLPYSLPRVRNGGSAT